MTETQKLEKIVGILDQIIIKSATQWQLVVDGKKYNTKNPEIVNAGQKHLKNQIEIEFNRSSFTGKDGTVIEMKWIHAIGDSVKTEVVGNSVPETRIPVIDTSEFITGDKYDEIRKNETGKGYSFGMAINAAANETALLENNNVEFKKQYFFDRAKEYFSDIEQLRKELLK